MLWPLACKLNIFSYAPLIIKVWYLSRFYSRNAGLMPDLKGIESDGLSSIHIMSMLIIINAMMNLKQFGPVALETNWPGS